MTFPLPAATPEALGFDPERLERVCRRIERDIDAGRHPGAQVAVARHGAIVLTRTFGAASLEPQPTPANERTLWLLFSNTKVLVAAALWHLAEEGALRLTDEVARHLPGFEAHGKGELTILHLLTHQAGFPSATVPQEAWGDRDLLRRSVCDFRLEWTPGSRVYYHSLGAHWTAAALVEAVGGEDFRSFVRARVIEPLGLSDEIMLGLSEGQQERVGVMYRVDDREAAKPLVVENSLVFRTAGVPGRGGYATARGMAAFYQMLAGGGRLGGKRLFAKRTIDYVTRDFTGERVDEDMGMPMHRGLGPHLRGEAPSVRGLGSLAHPRTFGHGGIGSSYCWADPVLGVFFAFLSNAQQNERFHLERMDVLSNFVHAAIDRDP
jgi:CubicO group peptidase (beta-lactamase class C family)